MEGSQGGKRTKWLDFGSDPDHHADCLIENLAITQQTVSGSSLMKCSG